MNRITFAYREGEAALLLDGRPFLSGLTVFARFTRGGEVRLMPTALREDDGTQSLLFSADKYFRKLILTLRADGDSAVLAAEAETNVDHWMEDRKFSEYASLSLSYRQSSAPEGVLLHEMEDSVFWQSPRFPEDISALPPVTQSVLIAFGTAEHMHILPLMNDGFRTEMRDNGFVLSTGYYGSHGLSGYIAGFTVAPTPYDAIHRNFVFLREIGAVSVKPTAEREFPAMLDGFGFCTWDAFYKDVSAEGIYRKLDELREKGVRLRWLLIDDGWSQYDEMYLTDFTEDRKKFPDGLKNTVEKIKREYGVRYVGVWHAFTGYWQGILPGSPAFRAADGELVLTAEGYWLPKPDPDTAFRFFDRWHRYLASCGVDFVKVDNQGSYSSKIEAVAPATKAVRILHEALESSALKNFGNGLLNCMGMSTEDVLQSPAAPIMRTSDDYFPKRAGDFSRHAVQNAYNALLQRELHHCDFDMWWSAHESAEVSSVLRAVSGGPIYVSDEVGATDPTYIFPATDGEGGIYRCDGAAVPTADIIYTDCRAEKMPLKIYNRKGGAFVLAAFAVSDCTVSGEVRLSDIPEAHDDSYLCEEYFSGKTTLLSRGDSIPFTVGKNHARLYNLYPVTGKTVFLGRRDKYIGIATPRERKMAVDAVKSKENDNWSKENR